MATGATSPSPPTRAADEGSQELLELCAGHRRQNSQSVARHGRQLPSAGGIARPNKSATDTCTSLGAPASDSRFACFRSRHCHFAKELASTPCSSANCAAVRPLSFQALMISTHSPRERDGARLRFF